MQYDAPSGTDRTPQRQPLSALVVVADRRDSPSNQSRRDDQRRTADHDALLTAHRTRRNR